MVGRKVHGKFLTILVAFWGPTWLPKLPINFVGNFQNFRAISLQKFLEILVVFWGPIMVPKLLSIGCCRGRMV